MALTAYTAVPYGDTGMEQWEFTYNGRESRLLVPRNPLPGNPWVWRMEFYDIFPAVDVALARLGWHVGYHQVSDQYGCQAAIERLRDFQDYMEETCHLHRRPLLVGLSRGGLYAVNYAAAYPSRTSGLYLDAPVLDIRSWPGGLGNGDGDPACWKECMALYGLTERSAPGFAQNPMDKAEQLAATGLPIVGVVGLADTVVPYDENLKPFAQRYRDAGGRIRVIQKPGVGHHPHSLEDPTPVVEFVQAYCTPEDVPF